MTHYTTEDARATQELMQAQERIERERQRQGLKASRTATSTRAPGLPESQDLQENQVHQDLHESPSGDVAPSAVCKKETAQDLFASGNYNAISDGEFVHLAWEESTGKDWQNDGVSETWEFCRYLCAHPRFKSLSPAALVGKLRRLIDLEENFLETILAEIAHVRFAKGGGPLDWAVGMAAQYPISDPEELGLERYNRFLSIAGWLQVQRGSAPVYLPVEKLAKILNVTPRAVSTWRAIAMRQGVLIEVSAYERRKKATEFRFAVDRFGVLRERGNL